MQYFFQSSEYDASGHFDAQAKGVGLGEGGEGGVGDGGVGVGGVGGEGGAGGEGGEGGDGGLGDGPGPLLMTGYRGYDNMPHSPYEPPVFLLNLA